MNKLPKQKRDQLIVVALVTAVVAALLWFFVVSPQETAVLAVAKEAKELGEKIAKAEATIKNAQTIQEQFTLSTNLLRKIEEPMPPGDFYSWCVSTVTDFVKPYKDINIPSFSRDRPGKVGILANFPYKAASFTIKGTARYDDFGKFVADFENHFPYFLVENIELAAAKSVESSSASQPGADDPEKLNFNMDIVVLVKPTRQ
jgi:Tfp pilus assembly protein PilO